MTTDQTRNPPIPTEPSPQSVRLLDRTKNARKMNERRKVRGPGLHLQRGFMGAVGLWTRLRLPRDITARNVRYGENVRGLLVTAPEPHERAIVLWVHGGGFIQGSPRSHVGFIAHYARRTGLPIFVLRYRLAPEHPFPAAADDVLAGYRALLAAGHAAESIRLVGDSSGGALIAGLLGDLDRAELPMPAAVLLLSPLLDLSARQARGCDAISPDPWVAPDFVERSNRVYTGDTPLTDPRLDLLGADLSRWPRTLVQTGGTECLAGEARLLAERMTAAGAACEAQIWPGQVHTFPLVGAGKIPEADAAIADAARFLAV